MIASKGLRPALLFFASSGVSTTASISARKLSHGTSAVIASSGSPFSDNAASRLSASKNPSCPIARSAESRPHERDSHSTKRQPIIRGALKRMLSAPGLHPLVRRKILEYIEERNDGLYGNTGNSLRRFNQRLGQHNRDFLVADNRPELAARQRPS